MSDPMPDPFDNSVTSRRRFLRRVGALGAAGVAAAMVPGLAGEALAAGPAMEATTRTATTPLKHVIISCQENRSFDHYFGYYPNAGSFGVPPGYTQPDGHGGRVAPYHLTSSVTSDPSHQWDNIHAEWDQGKMNGFYTADGDIALGYYDSADLGFYYALANHFTLCGNFFCSVLGGTFPNRLYQVAGTSGGNTTNNIKVGSLTYPMILDAFETAGITWRNYNTGILTALAANNAMVLFAKWANDARMNHDLGDFYTDLRNGTLPQVSFLNPGLVNAEHAPASIQWGQQYMANVVQALIHSSAWSSAALIHTYDEGGGFFDHVTPPVFDAYGAGIRVPALVVSPYAKRGNVQGTLYEQSSILKFLEAVFGLPTLASINHQFDQRTPATNNQAAPPGAMYGPPAPPRDARSDIGNLLECFNFGQDPTYRPRLPRVPAPRR